MLTKDRKPPDGFSDWDSFYEHGAREILPKLERAPSHVRDVVNTTRRAFEQASGGKTPTVADLVAAIHPVTALTFKISDDVRDVLARSVITATSVKLPEQLDRKLYDAVNKALAGSGGKWNKKAAAHIFDRDPREALGLAIETGEAVNIKTKLQAFYTPAPLADRMAAAAKLKHGYRVLEPSAGAGALVTAAMNIAAVDVDAYDINPGVQDRLSAIGVGQAALTGGSLSVRIQDFLLAEPNPIYDAVLMNPPFQGGQDMAHVTHAWRFLMSGGVLVAIMGSGPSGFRDATTKAAVAFRALVASAKSSEVTEIPGGTFEDTGVATVMLVMRKA